MSTHEIGKKYVALCREGRREEVLRLFSKDAVSVEAAAPPGGERTAKGLEAIRAKGKWWSENHEVHRAELSGPYPHDDRFAVRFSYEVTHKPSGERRSMDEVGLFTVEGGKISREEFFYPVG
jgi:ketosteroid isomerase-like protein